MRFTAAEIAALSAGCDAAINNMFTYPVGDWDAHHHAAERASDAWLRWIGRLSPGEPVLPPPASADVEQWCVYACNRAVGDVRRGEETDGYTLAEAEALSRRVGAAISTGEPTPGDMVERMRR
jgi:hypothetical protein